MSPTIHMMLPKLGIPRTFPWVTAFGPVKYQGTGILHPWALQIAAHLQALFEAYTNNTQTAIILKATFEQLTLETGIETAIGEPMTFSPTAIATNTWNTSLWETTRHTTISFSQYQKHLFLFGNTRTSTWWVHFTKPGTPAGHYINSKKCQMYLGVVTIADMTTFDGEFIQQQVIDGANFQVLWSCQWPWQPPP